MPSIEADEAGDRRLKPKAAEQVYWDKTLSGFGLKVTPGGPQGVHRDVPDDRQPATAPEVYAGALSAS
jgi:hypothetical protein